MQKRVTVLKMSVRNQLYFAPLEKRLLAQRKSLNKQYELDQIQIAKMNILRESERMQLTKAETMLRIDQFKEKLATEQKLLAEKRATKNNSAIKQDTFVAATPNSNAAIAESLDFSRGFPTYTESAYGQPIYADTEAPTEYDDEEEKADPDTVYPIQVSGQLVQITKQVIDQAYTLPEGKLYFIEQIPPQIWEKLAEKSPRLNLDELDKIAKTIKVPTEIYKNIKDLAYNNNPKTIKNSLRELIEADDQKTRDQYKSETQAKKIREQLGFMY